MQKIVDEYAKISAKRKALKKRELELHDELVSFLRKKECPTKGPYLVKLNDVKRSEFSWEVYARKLLKKFGYPVKEIKSMVRVAKTKAGKKIVPTLYVEVNPKWKE